MRTGEMVSVHEYLSTSYSPDCDYVDGVLLERNVGEKDHSKLQVRLTLFFGQRCAQWGVSVFTGQRVQVRKECFRIADVCVVRPPEPDEEIFTSPRCGRPKERGQGMLESTELRTVDPAIVLPVDSLFA